MTTSSIIITKFNSSVNYLKGKFPMIERAKLFEFNKKKLMLILRVDKNVAGSCKLNLTRTKPIQTKVFICNIIPIQCYNATEAILLHFFIDTIIS